MGSAAHHLPNLPQTPMATEFWILERPSPGAGDWAMRIPQCLQEHHKSDTGGEQAGAAQVPTHCSLGPVLVGSQVVLLFRPRG